MSNAIKQLLTYRDVQTILGVCRETVRREVRRGRLKPVPIGTRNVRFRRRDVERLAEKGLR